MRDDLEIVLSFHLESPRGIFTAVGFRRVVLIGLSVPTCRDNSVSRYVLFITMSYSFQEGRTTMRAISRH